MKVFLRSSFLLSRRCILNKDDPGKKAEEYRLHFCGHFSAAKTSVVDVEGHHRHGAGKGHKADGHSVVEA
jgi:hypothetical protein